MPIESKEGFNTSKYVREAAQRRAADQNLSQFSKSEIDRRAETIMALRSTTPTFPTIAPGVTIDAVAWSDYLKDTKMHISIIANSGKGIEEEIDFNVTKNFAVLDDLQREVLAINSYVTEEEVKANNGYSTVHYNSFNRAFDYGLPYDNPEWIVDYKTGLPFMPQNISDVVPNTGITLPLRHEQAITISNVTIVSEETSFGDTKTPILSNEPKNLLRKDRIFRHVIAERLHDNTSRKYNHRPVTCSLLLELAGLQLVNALCIRPVGQSPVFVEAVSYFNESNEEVQLTEVELDNKVELTILFEPIRTRQLKVKLKQYAPVEQAYIENTDFKVREINKLLRAADFNQLLPEESESIQGAIYDFSLETIKCKLRAYENLGAFRSIPVEVTGPIACSLDNDIQTIEVGTEQRQYESTSFLTEGEVLVERYLGVDLKTAEGGQALHDLIPIPNSMRNQREFLPMFSGESKANLFPDLFWNVSKDQKWTSAEWTLGNVLVITFTEPHSLADAYAANTLQSDAIVSVAGTGENGKLYSVRSTSWYFTSSTDLYITVTDGISRLPNSITSEELTISPYVYVEAQQASPFNVYKEDELLTFGTDYTFSLDSGSTWYSDYSFQPNWSYISSSAKAGAFKIKVTNIDSNKQYFIDYRPYHNQQLSQSPGVSLKRGRIVFARKYKKAFGGISPVIVSRADNANPYLTSILKSYFFKVREANVS